MDLCEITIKELQQQFMNKKLSIKEAVQEYLQRIEELDRGEQGHNSVLEVNPDALAIAEELDRQGCKENQLLYGVPVLLKDNIATDDRTHTSAGALALADSIAGYDADIVKSLRRQGAVILGKANMTEFANYTTEDMPNGYSSRGGRVKNPYNHEKDPSGSSSGSAVAVAANLCTASIGTDTCNSIVAPGLVNGIVGLRPSTGTISQKGIIPISFTLDTAGPFTRTVKDAAIMFAALTETPVITRTKNSLKGMTIGYNEWNPGDLPEETAVKTEEIIRELEKQGAIIRKIVIPETQYLDDVMKYEFKYAMNQYLKTLPEAYPMKTLKDIIEYNNQHPEETLKYGQTCLLDAENHTSGQCDEEKYLKILVDRRAAGLNVREQLQGMDLCIMLAYNNIMHYTGLPILTIPCGLYGDGLPCGIQMTALKDDQLIQNAFAIEEAVGHRVKPGM